MPYLIYVPLRCGAGSPYVFSAVTLQQSTMIEDFRAWGWRVEHHLPHCTKYRKHLDKDTDLRRWRSSIEKVWERVRVELGTERKEKERKQKEKGVKAKGRKAQLVRQAGHWQKEAVGLEEGREEMVVMEEMHDQELDVEMIGWLRDYERRNDGRDRL